MDRCRNSKNRTENQGVGSSILPWATLDPSVIPTDCSPGKAGGFAEREPLKAAWTVPLRGPLSRLKAATLDQAQLCLPSIFSFVLSNVLSDHRLVAANRRYEVTP